jgi:hypothetical protein
MDGRGGFVTGGLSICEPGCFGFVGRGDRLRRDEAAWQFVASKTLIRDVALRSPELLPISSVPLGRT